MNQKNSLGLNSCFMDLDDPIHLFDTWMEEAKKTEPNDPNAVALATSNKNNVPSVRMVLLKDFNQNGFFEIILSFHLLVSHPNIPNCVTAPTTLNFLPNLFCKTNLAIAPAATLDAVSLADDLPPPL